jgi:hypothetical protein
MTIKLPPHFPAHSFLHDANNYSQLVSEQQTLDNRISRQLLAGTPAASALFDPNNQTISAPQLCPTSFLLAPWSEKLMQAGKTSDLHGIMPRKKEE